MSLQDALRPAADAILEKAVSRAEAPVPGVVAMVTDREGEVYRGSAGVRRVGGDEPMTPDTVFALFSTTKAVTATAALQLVEEGRLDLDAPAGDYVPELRDLQVIEGFADDGTPRLRPAASAVTTRQLLTHTAGFAYDFFDESYRRLTQERGVPGVTTCTLDALRTPLVFDPGTRWQYGANVDWAGQVVERIAGARLGEVFAERIFAPLGMTETAFTPAPELEDRIAEIHARGEDGSLTPTGLRLPSPPEVDMGGHGLYGTVGDYLRFIRMWLADGRADDGTPVLAPETVRDAVRNHIGDLSVGLLPGVIPSLSNDAEYFPGQPKSWSLAFMVNDEKAPTGRPAGESGWAGLANLYYWIDRSTGVGGFWATQILPFGDPTSFAASLEFESAVYAALG